LDDTAGDHHGRRETGKGEKLAGLKTKRKISNTWSGPTKVASLLGTIKNIGGRLARGMGPEVWLGNRKPRIQSWHRHTAN